MTINLRHYQAEANAAVFEYWRQGGSNPLVDMATGLGKSLTIGDLAREICTFGDDVRAMMVTHVQELVGQNFKALLDVWPSVNAGIYSAGLNKRQLGRKVTYASIQSIYNKGELCGFVDVVLVDEAHLVPHDAEGMYHTFFNKLREVNPDLRIVGFTATPYRMNGGRLDQGKNRLFDQIVYTYGVGDGVRDGWLAPLSGYKGEVEFDVTGIDRAGGDFVQKQLDEAFNAQERVLLQACEEIVAAGQDRKSWLLFGAGVRHAMRTAEIMRDIHGIDTHTITGETPKDERARLINAFKRGDIKCLTNANVLTTGFDASRIDLIGMLRSTLSTGLYVQIMGRGTRVHDVDLNVIPTAELRRQAIAASQKADCRVLDFGGNIRRHGPVDGIWIKPKVEMGESEAVERVTVHTVKARECKHCNQLIGVLVIVCPHCGYEDEEMIKAKHEAEAEKNVNPMNNGEAPKDEADVMGWSFRIHRKRGAEDTALPTLRVDILAGLQQVSEFLAFDHEGYGRTRAIKWWKDHKGDMPPPESVDEAYARRHELRKPSHVVVQQDGSGYLRIIDRGFDIQNDDDRNAVRENRAPTRVDFSDPVFFDDSEIPF